MSFLTSKTFIILIISLILGLSNSLELHETKFQPCGMVKGSCFQNILLSFNHTSDENECKTFCENTPKCKWFSYRPDTSICGAFEQCDEPSIEMCPDCLSGKIDCCDVTGELQGKFLNFFPANDLKSCQKLCHEKRLCQWSTFNDNICTLLESVTGIDKSCKTCISGQKWCGLAEKPSRDCRVTWNKFQDYCYRISTDVKDNYAADRICHSLNNANLADVRNSEIDSFVQELTKDHDRPVWIGGKKIEGKWKWSDGTLVDYSNWFANQSKKEGCMYIYKGKWYASSCTGQADYICQYYLY